MRDFQKSKVYSWENKHVFPKMNQKVQPIEQLKNLCGYMWGQMGLINPPKLYIDPDYKNKSTGGRHQIRFMKTMLTEPVLVHEMAHSMNLCEHRNVFDHHGPNYVADYCKLLSKFYGFDINYLLFTLNKEKVKIDLATLYGDVT